MRLSVLPMILALLSPQDDPSVKIGRNTLSVKLRIRNGERTQETMDFGPVGRKEGILVAYTRERFQHYYHWTRTSPGKRIYDIAFLDSEGKVTEVTEIKSELMKHPDPPWGINKIRGLTSKDEVQYALFLQPRNARRLKIKKGAKVEIDLGGAKIDPMPSMVVGEKKIFLEIVWNEPNRSRGLTYRTGISKGEGMIFAFPNKKNRPFWMYHTYISIDVAYVTKEGELVEINPMKKMRNPDDENAARRSMVPTKVETVYVLETAYKWMKEAGFKVGDKFTLPKELTSLKPPRSPFE